MPTCDQPPSPQANSPGASRQLASAALLDKALAQLQPQQWLTAFGPQTGLSPAPAAAVAALPLPRSHVSTAAAPPALAAGPWALTVDDPPAGAHAWKGEARHEQQRTPPLASLTANSEAAVGGPADPGSGACAGWFGAPGDAGSSGSGSSTAAAENTCSMRSSLASRLLQFPRCQQLLDVLKLTTNCTTMTPIMTLCNYSIKVGAHAAW